MPSPQPSQLSIVDEVSALPFPERNGRLDIGDGGWSGPGHHVAVLRRSQDFWDDRSEETVEAAERELEADLAALTDVLAGRWGSPATVDLWPYLGVDDPDPGRIVPEPLGYLSNVAGAMRLWRLPRADRWLSLAIGQADPEFPLELIVAVGEASSLPR
ncbi:hypothetical protein AB0D99_11520 [Streptomyces sp. NPDC047971]|uniref:hypothetical protein n=1 Tax=Streptomyces sp. NPDC047971 TaxID=3154499 RepID=UPI0033ECA64B